MVRAIMITITLRFYSKSISPIFLPLFSSVMCLSRPTGIGLPDMFAPMSNLEYRNVSPLLRKIFLELAFSSYLLVRLPGLMTLEAVFWKQQSCLSLHLWLQFSTFLTFFLVFFLTFGKLQRSRHFIRMVRCLTVLIIVLYQFCPCCL